MSQHEREVHSTSHDASLHATSIQPLTTQPCATSNKPKSHKQSSRGNRKLQRFRAKLRKRGFDNPTIETMINDYNQPINIDPDRDETSTLTHDDTTILLPSAIQVDETTSLTRRYHRCIV
jgi:hypothetical protein